MKRKRLPQGPWPTVVGWVVFCFPLVVAAALAVFRFPVHVLVVVGLVVAAWAVFQVVEWVLGFFIK